MTFKMYWFASILFHLSIWFLKLLTGVTMADFSCNALSVCLLKTKFKLIIIWNTYLFTLFEIRTFLLPVTLYSTIEASAWFLSLCKFICCRCYLRVCSFRLLRFLRFHFSFCSRLSLKQLFLVIRKWVCFVLLYHSYSYGRWRHRWRTVTYRS